MPWTTIPGGQGPDGMGLRDALLEAIRDATEDKAVKVAVITGNGSVFSAGADLKAEAIEIPPEHRRRPTVARDDGLLYGWYRLLESIWRSETPFIAAVNGPAIGGGCQFALACDLIYASETATLLGDLRPDRPPPRGRRGVAADQVPQPSAGQGDGPPERAPERQQAVEWRLINGCVPAEELESVVADVARKLATLGAPSKGPAASGEQS